MKRYLIVFIYDGVEFGCEIVMSDSMQGALKAFDDSGLLFDELYSVSLAR